MSGAATEMRKLMRKARKRGWTVVQSKRHYLLTWVNGGRVTASLSPSSQSGIRDCIADMRRVEQTTLQER